MHVLFYGEDGAKAKAEANRRRKEQSTNAKFSIMAAHSIACQEFAHLPEATSIEFLPDVSESERVRLGKVFARLAVPPPAPPPPPPPVDPLARLPAKWRDMKPGELGAIATAVNGGRTPETKAQAISIIEAALAARSN